MTLNLKVHDFRFLFQSTLMLRKIGSRSWWIISPSTETTTLFTPSNFSSVKCWTLPTSWDKSTLWTFFSEVVHLLISCCCRGLFVETFIFRRVHSLWHRCPCNDRIESGRAGRSHGASISQNDQMHFPQIRSFWHCWKIRWPLRPTFEHYQREDLRLPLVLVYYPHRHYWIPNLLQAHSTLHAQT